jgi:hypothetical protein
VIALLEIHIRLAADIVNLFDVYAFTLILPLRLKQDVTRRLVDHVVSALLLTDSFQYCCNSSNSCCECPWLIMHENIEFNRLY